MIKLASLALALVAFSVNTFAADTDTLSAGQKKQVENVVKDYLVRNPEVVIMSLQGYQKKQMDEARKTIAKTQKDSPKFVDALFHQTNDPVAGNPNGAVTVVEFFDYQCPHCVEMTPVLEDLIKGNSELRVIFKEFPIRGPGSELASKAALAANMQGKYFEFHKGIMNAKQQNITQDGIMDIAKSVGLDVDKMKTDMNGPKVAEQLKNNFKLGQNLQLLGTPAFFVAKTGITKAAPSSSVAFIPGQVGKDQLQDLINKAK